MWCTSTSHYVSRMISSISTTLWLVRYPIRFLKTVFISFGCGHSQFLPCRNLKKHFLDGLAVEPSFSWPFSDIFHIFHASPVLPPFFSSPVPGPAGRRSSTRPSSAWARSAWCANFPTAWNTSRSFWRSRSRWRLGAVGVVLEWMGRDGWMVIFHQQWWLNMVISATMVWMDRFHPWWLLMVNQARNKWWLMVI